MDMSSGEWLSDLANEDPATLMHHCQMMMSSIVENVDFNNIFQPSDVLVSTNNNNSTIIKSEDHDFDSTYCESKIKPSNNHGTWSNSDGKLICFGSSSKFETENNIGVKPKKEVKILSKNNVRSTCNNEHVVAERLRREKMTQAFVALSALIPGLKKMDKASILTEATNYVKQLEERAKELEHQKTKTVVESAYLVKKMQNQNLDDTTNYSNREYNKTNNHHHFLEIEARFLNNNVLIRIHSLKKQGIIQTILEEIGKLNITTLNCQTMPFGSYAIDITIIAKLNDDFRMTMEDLVKHLEDTITVQNNAIALK